MLSKGHVATKLQVINPWQMEVGGKVSINKKNKMTINQIFLKNTKKNKTRTWKKEDQKIKTIQKKKKRCVRIFKTWKKWFKDLKPKDHNDWNGEMLEQNTTKMIWRPMIKRRWKLGKKGGTYETMFKHEK